jgi:hypothetical protein
MFSQEVDQLLEEQQQAPNIDCLELLNSQLYWEICEKDGVT